jgi:propionate catabolism operon transcriptional regulator
MPLSLQTRLLRVLEEREIVRVGGVRPIPIDVRIISATHCDLEQRIKEGRFRADLFYRLAVLRLALPGLRERPNDIVELAQWCLKHASAAMGSRPHPNLQVEVEHCRPLLQSYSWPGNVRELRNAMERVALSLSVTPLQAITPSLLAKLVPELKTKETENEDKVLTSMPQVTQTDAPLVSMSKQEESLDILLVQYQNNKEKLAKHLGISRTTLWRKLRNKK